MRQLLGEIFLDSTKVGVLQGTLLRFFFLNLKKIGVLPPFLQHPEE